MVPLSVTLNDLEGHLAYLKPLKIMIPRKIWYMHVLIDEQEIILV